MPDQRLTFTLVGRDHLSRALREAGVSSQRLRKDLLGLGSAAAIPAAAAGAAAALSLAAGVAAAGVAVGAFGAAIAPQVIEIAAVSEAHKNYKAAVQSSGRSSQAAAEAQRAYSESVKHLPKETQESAAAFISLKEAYSAWSDSVADDTMPVLTKSFQTFSALLPKMTPLVRGTSTELDRMMTILAGASASDEFDQLIDSFTEFSTGALRGTNDGLINLIRIMRGFDSGPLGEFFAEAQSHGPLVADTLMNVAQAAGHLLAAGNDLGVAMLHIANGFAQLVNAIPTEVLSTLLQLYAAFRLVALAGAGIAAATVVVQRFGRQLLIMQVAAAGTGGALAGLRAAFMALSATAKATVILAVIAALVVGISKLQNISKATPPDVEALERSLFRLARTGKVSGESVRLFGSDLAGFGEAVARIAHPSVIERIGDFNTQLFSLGMLERDELEEARGSIQAFDETLGKMVAAGHADLAAVALKRYGASAVKGGTSLGKFRDQLPDYKAALENAKIEQQLAGDAMGLFGQQAIKTKAQLDEQKASADGLRQSIQALNEVNRAGLGGMIGFEQAIDNAAKAARENAGALTMVGGRLVLNSQKARDAATGLQDLADKTDEAAAAARESGQSWSYVNGIYDRGRQKLIASAIQMGLTRDQAKALAAQILKTPDKTAKLKGNLEDLAAKVREAKKKIKSVPPSKRSELRGTVADLEAKVRAAKRALKSVPKSKRSALRATIAQLEEKVRQARAAVGSVKGKTISIRATFIGPDNPYVRKAHGGPIGYAGGGPLQGYPGGGPVRGAGTSTSDSIPIMASNGEYMIRSAAVRKYGVRMFDELNSLQARVARPARPGNGGGGSAATTSNSYTYHLYQRDITVRDLESLQRRQEAYARVGRPH